MSGTAGDALRHLGRWGACPVAESDGTRHTWWQISRFERGLGLARALHLGDVVPQFLATQP